MIIFQPESHVAFCKTLDGAQKLVEFFAEEFTDHPSIQEHLTFRSFIETDGRVSVHCNIPVTETFQKIFKEAVAEFKAQFLSAQPVA